MLTAEDVLSQRFQIVKLREGYDQDEVDDFLDRVVESLHGTGAVRMTAQDVLAARFTATKFRAGYDQDQVDDFLDRVVEALAHQAELTPPPDVAPGRAPAQLASPMPAEPSAPVEPVNVAAPLSAGDLVSRLQLVRAARVSTAADALGVRLPDGTRVAIIDLRATPDGIELTAG
jgi:DivIVA domain-containing protein